MLQLLWGQQPIEYACRSYTPGLKTTSTLHLCIPACFLALSAVHTSHDSAQFALSCTLMTVYLDTVEQNPSQGLFKVPSQQQWRLPAQSLLPEAY